MDLTDEQWKLLEVMIPKPTRREDGRGRPWRDPREVLNGILWVLRTGAPWKDLPERYPPYQTCHRGLPDLRETHQGTLRLSGSQRLVAFLCAPRHRWHLCHQVERSPRESASYQRAECQLQVGVTPE